MPTIQGKIKLRKWVINIAFAITAFGLICFAIGCKSGSATKENIDTQPLPFLGQHDVEMRQLEAGVMVADTAYYTLPKFVFTNQFKEQISHRDYLGKIFVAEFFFSHCRSICPIMSAQMARLQQLVKNENRQQEVWFLSHSVDPLYDVPDTLKAYGEKLDADFTTWNFVTGQPKDIYWQAESGYMLSAFPSDTADGGFFHTDKLTLVDREMHIRGYYDGTSTKEVDKLFKDIKRLLNEYEHNNDER